MNQNQKEFNVPLFFILFILFILVFLGSFYSFLKPRSLFLSSVSVLTPETVSVYRLTVKQNGTTKTDFGFRIQLKN